MDKQTILPATGNKKPRLFYGYIIVLIGFATMLIMHGLLYSFGVFLKPVSAEFGWTRAMTSGAYSMSLFVLGLFYIITGRLNDRFGPRIVTTACGFLLGLGYLLMSQVNALWQLYLFWGLLVGIGIGGGWVPMISTVARWFVKRRGMMTGIVAAGVGLGTITVPPVASWLISSYDWRTSFLVIGITALALLILAAQFLKRDPSAIGQLPYGKNEANKDNLTSDATGLSLREASHTKQFWMLCTLLLFTYISKLTIMVHIVPHATDLGISPMLSASILATIGGLSIVGRIGIGGISDRVGGKSTLIICFILLSATLFWLQLAKEVWMLYLFAITFGFSTGGLATLESPVIAEFFGLKAHGAILGVITFVACTGGAISSLMAGHIFDITGSYYSIFWIFAVLAITSLILVSLLKPTRKENLR
ncbi:MAG: hypothetical protein CL875_05860 [Dehalococcoidales bacterium]|nr:hypothetical protein [Dehalococcoidales bacterium]